jgi:3-phosphoshikimate 1-carboxyvinyltransferase
VTPDKLEIHPIGPASGSIRPPGSKSITNRALVCAALARGRSTLLGALDSEDTQVMIDSLGRLGIDVRHDAAQRRVEVLGCGGTIARSNAELYVGNSGTSMRFLASMVALGCGQFRLDGNPRMRQRPIEDLVTALRQLGVDALSDGGFPPVTIHAAGMPTGRAVVAGDVSSQFLSGLLMAVPAAAGPVELVVAGTLVSKPYVHMTLGVMRAFGVSMEVENLQRFATPGAQQYQACRYAIEPDASAASYFFAAAAITRGRVTVEGLSRDSLQGDVAFCTCLERMGCQVEYVADRITVTGRSLAGIEVDMNAISDTVQTLAAVALFARGPTTITGVGHIRHKETDRIHALAVELRKLGAAVAEWSDGLRIEPADRHGAEIDTYDDHRMAMSMALVGLGTSGVVIRDPGCTRKTYPEFFQDLARLAPKR